jgi:DNA-binding SARP family transcriptional activator
MFYRFSSREQEEQMMSQLQLSLLGEPIVKHGEDTLTFSTRKALALLVYLAVEGGLHTRKALSEAFWPELDAKHGRAALRATLLELRRLVKRSHGPGERDHLRIERDTLGIAQDGSLLVDLHLVESASKLVGRGIASLAGQAREELLQHLEQAARLVRGPFLAGFTLRDSQFFDDWSTQHREHWHRRVYQVFDALSLLYEQGREVESAIESVTRWLSFDPLNEEGYRRLMRLRFSQGDRVGALRAYSRCRSVLADELQVEPEPETVALANRMRHAAPLRPVQAQPPQALAGPSPAHLLDGPFLGRVAEFGTLIERYQHAHAGGPQLVLLQGEAGIGKTRLSSEFVRWAQAQGADVLLGKALQTGRQLPYQPLSDVLRHRLEQEQGPEGHLSDVWLGELACLLPELRERYPDLPAPATDEAFGHNRLFKAIARLIRRWAARGPLVLLLDDMQWADTATLDLLLYLARRLDEQPAPVLLLFNLSTGPGGCTDAQPSWLMALKRTGLPLTELLLAPFTQEETRRFVQELAWAEQPVETGCTSSTGGCPMSGEASAGRKVLLSFTDWLYRYTSGQPLYLVETLNELMSRGILFPSLKESGAWGLVLRTGLLAQTPVGELIPQTLRELIRAQLARLSPSAWTLLVTASVLEAGLTFECLCQVAGLDELEGLRVLEELLRGGWLSEAMTFEEAQALRGYALARQMIREVVYQEAGAIRRRVVQRRLAALIREGIADEQGEDARLPHAAAADKHAPAGQRKTLYSQVFLGPI